MKPYIFAMLFSKRGVPFGRDTGMKENLVRQQVESQQEKPRCPRCGSFDIRRSSSQGLIATIFQMFGREPYRCRSCRRRFYRPGHAVPHDDE